MIKPITTLRLSIEEKRYAKALSVRKGCPLREGSTAYALKWLLHKYAEKENVPLGDVYTSHNR